VKTSTEVK